LLYIGSLAYMRFIYMSLSKHVHPGSDSTKLPYLYLFYFFQKQVIVFVF